MFKKKTKTNKKKKTFKKNAEIAYIEGGLREDKVTDMYFGKSSGNKKKRANG